MKRPIYFMPALALTLVVSSGCIICPFPENDLGASQFITYKIAELIPAGEWTPIGEWTFHQSFEITGATGVANAQMRTNRQRVKTKLRYRLYDLDDEMISEQIYKFNFKNNGNVKKLAEKKLEKNIQPGYRATLEAFAKKEIPKDTLLGFSFNVRYER